MPEKSNFFYENFRKIEKIFNNFVIFWEDYFTDFRSYGVPSKGRDISVEFYYLVENFIKKWKKSPRSRRNIGKGVKFLEILGEN